MKPTRDSKNTSSGYDVKHRNYLIQQEKLRHMGHSTFANKALDADRMIENLLSRSETFMKNRDTNQGLPSWLISNSNSLPKIYKNVWISVKSKSLTGAQQFCDTQLLTSVLLTSGISTENLGYIWALCNKTVPGMLTEQELYNILALIGLAQLGRPWNNLKFLESIEEPVIPHLNYNLLNLNGVTVNPGIHSTYFPNTMAMSIPSPIQMLQHTTNSVTSNNSASLELNASLLETMLSNNLQPSVVSGGSQLPSYSKKIETTQNISWKDKENESTDNWTDFIDHTANVEQQSIMPDLSVKNLDSSLKSNSKLPSEKNIKSIFDCNPKSVSDRSSQSVFSNSSNVDLDSNAKLVFDPSSVPMLCDKNVTKIFDSNAPQIASKIASPISESNSSSVFENSQNPLCENSCKSVLENATFTLENYSKLAANVKNSFSISANNSKQVSEPEKLSNSNKLKSINFYDSALNDLPSVIISDGKSEPVFVDEFTTKFSKLTSNYNPSHSLKDVKVDGSNDDDFSDFQSFDFLRTNPVSKTSSLETSGKKLKMNENLFDILADCVEVPFKKEQTSKNLISSNEVEESLNKGFVVENPLYLSDNDSMYDNNSVKSLKFDSLSLDADSSQGLSMINSRIPAPQIEKASTGSTLNADKQNKLLEISYQVPNPIPANTLEDKYSVFRMLETQEVCAFSDKKNDDDDFGDFLAADTNLSLGKTSVFEGTVLANPTASLFTKPLTENIIPEENAKANYSQSVSVQEECANICVSILKEAVKKFSSLSSDILKLVLCEDKCIDYIQDLVQIYYVAERMTQNTSYGLTEKKLSNVWRELNSYVSTKFSCEECDEENDYSCTLCNTNSGPVVIKYGTAYYHLPCINFYLNCVNSNLPF